MGKKSLKQWIWLAMDVETREIVGLYVGSRSCKGQQNVYGFLYLGFIDNVRWHILTFGKLTSRVCPAQGLKLLARKQVRLIILSGSTALCVNVLLDWLERRFHFPRN